jgi:hypothetical protein
MARRTQTYAIRLAVEGGGQVKAELVSVGQSGEQSLKRIESAGQRASGGLKGLGCQAELLRTGIRTLGGAIAGVATVGGLASLVDRSISAPDAIGETASKIGIGVEALQELRYAASLAGVEQQTLDMALQRFVRRVAEAANGTGEAKDALAQMRIALRDQSGNLRQSEDLLGDVADAFARIEDPAERVRLAFKLFDSEGVALVNLLSDGSDALEAVRERARSLGIVLDEHLVRDAERARTELDTLSQVISANLTRAALEAGPVIADLSSWLADIAGKAGIAWERLFDAPEEKTLRTLRYKLDLRHPRSSGDITRRGRRERGRGADRGGGRRWRERLESTPSGEQQTGGAERPLALDLEAEARHRARRFGVRRAGSRPQMVLQRQPPHTGPRHGIVQERPLRALAIELDQIGAAEAGERIDECNLRDVAAVRSVRVDALAVRYGQRHPPGARPDGLGMGDDAERFGVAPQERDRRRVRLVGVDGRAREVAPRGEREPADIGADVEYTARRGAVLVGDGLKTVVIAEEDLDESSPDAVLRRPLERHRGSVHPEPAREPEPFPADEREPETPRPELGAGVPSHAVEHHGPPAAIMPRRSAAVDTRKE